MELTVEREGDAATFGLIGDVDSTSSPELRAAVLGALGDGATSLVFDCSSLTFVDSAGLSVIVEAYQQVQLRWGGVTILQPSASLVRMLEITGLDKVLTIDPG